MNTCELLMKNKMQRIVLDTNCLLISIPRKSKYHKIFTDFILGKYILCVSNEIILEYEEILTRKIGHKIAVNILNAILSARNIEYISPQLRYHLIEADPDDNKFVDCAIAANAKYIISQDRHYDVVKFNPKFNFTAVDIDYFLTKLEKSSGAISHY